MCSPLALLHLQAQGEGETFRSCQAGRRPAAVRERAAGRAARRGARLTFQPPLASPVTETASPGAGEQRLFPAPAPRPPPGRRDSAAGRPSRRTAAGGPCAVVSCYVPGVGPRAGLATLLLRNGAGFGLEVPKPVPVSSPGSDLHRDAADRVPPPLNYIR